MPAKTKKKDEEVDGYTKALNYAKTGLVTARMATVAVLAPSVHAYFWWCFVIYLTCAIIVLAERSPIQEFFCSLPPQDVVDGQDFGGQGCTNCPATLLMCELGTPCYKAVMNITYSEVAAEPDMQFHQEFLQATRDLKCNEIIRAARSPLDALRQIYNNKYDPNVETVNAGCIVYHCRVLTEALNSPDLVNLEGGTCSNIWGTKGWGGTMTGAADECVCQDLITDPNEIDDVIEMNVIDVCPNLLESMCDPNFYSYRFHWCDELPVPTPSAARPAPTLAPTPAVTPAPPVPPTPPPTPAPCSAGGGLCGFGSIIFKPCCTGTCSDVGNAMYCLAPLSEAAADAGDCSAGGQICGLMSEETNACCAGTTCKAVNSLMFCLEEGRRLEEGGGNCGGDSASADCQRPAAAEAWHREASAPEERRLTDLPDYTVSDWGECTCYQQCIPGVRTRTVDCLAAACQAPAPMNQEPCTCDHCARCMIDIHLSVLEIMFFAQAGLAFLAFLCYLYVNTMKEDQLVKISWARWFMGIICKRFPPIVKYLVLSTAITLVLMWCRIWAPQLLSTNRDMECWRSYALKECTGILMTFWVVQLWLTHQAKKFTRRPPWLYSPERSNWPPFLKTAQRFVRLLGP